MEKIDVSPPQHSSEAFLYYWNMFIGDVADRDNLKKSHLYQLRVLCDLCVEYDELKEVIALSGRTYESHGRNGTQIKLNPEVTHMKSIVTEIRNYSRMLGIMLVKDTKLTKKDDEEGGEFA
jgi:phage terminase small subunit